MTSLSASRSRKICQWVLHLAMAILLRPEASAAEPADAQYSFLDRGPNQRRVQRVRLEQDENGDWIHKTNSWVQLEDGLNYWSEDLSDWVESSEDIELTRTGAIARHGQHVVNFSANGNDPAGAIDIVVNRTVRLRASLLAVRYFDPISGQSAVVAMAKDSQGELLPPNQVVYRDVLDKLSADLVVTYRRSGLESDLVLREAPPSPQDFGFLPEIARVEVLTEFFGAPEPARQSTVLDRVDDPALRAKLAEPEWIDEELDFGANRIGLGRAFAWSERDAARRQPEKFAAVGKRWIAENGGRTALVESVEYLHLFDDLVALPGSDARRRGMEDQSRRWAGRAKSEIRSQALRATSSVSPALSAGFDAVLPPRQFAEVQTWPGQTRTMLLASTKALARPGVVLDWTSVVDGTQNMTFRGDETYYVTGNVYVYGTTILEGGSVFKFPCGTNGVFTGLTVYGGPFISKTSLYRPAVFTADSDNSVGEAIVAGAPDPANAYPGLGLRFYNIGAPVIAEHLRIKYAYQGIYFMGNVPSNVVRHCQFYRTWLPVVCNTNSPVKVLNALVQMSRPGCEVFTGNNTPFYGENLTVVGSTRFVAGGTVTLTNCLLVGMTNGATFSGANNIVLTTIPAGTFQVAGAGSYYLPPNSQYLNAGTPNIDPVLARDLRRLTTSAPTSLAGTLNVGTTLLPTVARDTDLPDIGYHYSPVDYLVSALSVTNCTLTVTEGTAIGVQGSLGIKLRAFANLVFRGSPANRARLVRYHCVQEDSDPLGGTSGASFSFVSLSTVGTNAAARASIAMTNTDISQLAVSRVSPGSARYLVISGPLQGYFANISLTDCDASGITMVLNNGGSGSRSVVIKNCLFQACGVSVLASPEYVSIQNCSFVFGDMLVNNIWGSPCPIWNNLYACDTASVMGPGAYSISNNAFAAGLPSFGSSAVTNLIPDFVAGPLGRYYYPTNGLPSSLASLIDAGSQSSAASGLYHYTVRADLAKEAASTVDIGYHYPASDSLGNLVDTDGDGVPDVVEDANGNGSLDGGESDWTTSQSGISGPASLLLYTPLR